MRTIIGCLATLTLCWSWGTAAADDTLAFEASYRNTHLASVSENGCRAPHRILGREPAARGRYPVFIYTVGTLESFDNAVALAAVERMAARGYVAATVEYPNLAFGACERLSARSECIYDAGSPHSAVAALCSRRKADCAQGIVVGGFSQGAVLAILAQNFDERVRAAYALGAGNNYSGYDLSACVDDGMRALPSDRLRIVDGEAEDYFGQDADLTRAQVEALTGLSCGEDAMSCLTGNGSGWYMVQHAEQADGYADHCYMRDGDCGAPQDQLDPTWFSGSGEWVLDANLEWLTGFSGP